MAKGVYNPRRDKPKKTGLLPVPNVEGVSAKILVEAMGGKAYAAQCLKVGEDLISLWMSGEVEAPFSAKVAMYWQSNYGFSLAFSESHWAHEYNCALKNEARARVEILEQAMKRAGLPLPPGRITSSAEMLGAGPTPLQGYERHALPSIDHEPEAPRKSIIPKLIAPKIEEPKDAWDDAAKALDDLCTSTASATPGKRKAWPSLSNSIGSRAAAF